MKNTLFAICFMVIAFSAYGIVTDDGDNNQETDIYAKEEARVDLVRTCQIRQNNELHEFDCVVINKHLARAL